MNRFKKKIVSIIALLGLTVFVGSMLYAEDATVTYVKGKVEVQRNGAWVALNKGDVIKVNEVVSTGFQSEAKVKLQNSFMTIGPLTRISITELKSTENSKTADISLSTGAVRSKVIHEENSRTNYTVRSPVAVASVRGTELLSRADGYVVCYEGAVAVYSAKNQKKAVAVEEIPMEEYDETALADTNYESATATTPAVEIAPEAPVGTVVVGRGQATVFTSNGNPEKPMDNAKRNLKTTSNTVQTAAESEVVIAGGSTTAVGGTSKTADVTEITTETKGGISIVIKIE